MNVVAKSYTRVLAAQHRKKFLFVAFLRIQVQWRQREASQ